MDGAIRIGYLKTNPLEAYILQRSVKKNWSLCTPAISLLHRVFVFSLFLSNKKFYLSFLSGPVKKTAVC